MEEIAEAVGLSASHVTYLFRRWAGLTPKAFCQAITLDHARRLLKDSASVLDASLEVGLSGPGRLHDLFVTHEAMSPGEYASGGAGLTLRYGFHPSPFGEALVVITDRGLAALAGWMKNPPPAPPRPMASQRVGRRARSRICGGAGRRLRCWRTMPQPLPMRNRVFNPQDWKKDRPLRVVLIGTDFEIRVWETLLRIPLGAATTYGDVAGAIGKPGAARAVGAAVGRNPISFVVPCHRVMGNPARSPAITGG